MQSAPDWRGLADDLEEREPEKGLSQRLGRGQRCWPRSERLTQLPVADDVEPGIGVVLTE
jgi:hypothetical protein